VLDTMITYGRLRLGRNYENAQGHWEVEIGDCS